MLISTLLNNYKALNLINNKALLNLRIFIKTIINNYIKIKIITLLIIKRRTYIIKKLFYKEKKRNIINFNTLKYNNN